MKKIFITALLMLIILGNIALANGEPRPTVNYPHSLGYRIFEKYVYVPQKNTIFDYDREYIIYSFFYTRGFGMTKNQLKEHKIKADDMSIYEMKMKEEQSSQGYGLLTMAILGGDEVTYMPPLINKATYIFDNSNVIGYVFSDPITLGHEYFTTTNDTFVTGVRNLPVNNNYLSNELDLPSGTSVTFYETTVGNFIERYGVFNIPNKSKSFVLESFYPANMENELKPLFLSTLNKNLQRIYLNKYFEDKADDYTEENGQLYLQELQKYIPTDVVNLDQEYDF